MSFHGWKIWNKISSNIKIAATTSSFTHRLFCPFVETKRIKFSASWWPGNEKYFCFLFIASLLYFKGMPYLFNFCKRIFLHVIPSLIIIPWFNFIRTLAAVFNSLKKLMACLVIKLTITSNSTFPRSSHSKMFYQGCLTWLNKEA